MTDVSEHGRWSIAKNNAPEIMVAISTNPFLHIGFGHQSISMSFIYSFGLRFKEKRVDQFASEKNGTKRYEG